MPKIYKKYTLMHKNIPVANVELDQTTGLIISIKNLLNPEHFPLGTVRKGIVKRRMLNEWWQNRRIPASRSGIQAALSYMGISTTQILAERCFGLSLSDQYWLRPCGLDLAWEEINFFDNDFATDIGEILFGSRPAKQGINFMSPDNTSDGWLKKKWSIINGKRCLIKGGSGATQQEPYNEVFASCIMKRLNIAHVPYQLMMLDNYPYSICEDFINASTELISAWSILQYKKQPNHLSLYNHYLNCCDKLGIADAQQSINQMIVLDYLIVNEDRHLNNFGVIRDAETLEYISTAPIYDSGTSMWYNKPLSLIKARTDENSKPFKSTHKEQIKLVTDFSWIDFSKLENIDDEFRKVVEGSIFIDSQRCEILCRELNERIKMLQQIANK